MTPSDYPRSNAVNYERPASVTREAEILELLKVGNAITAPRPKLISASMSGIQMIS